MKILIISRFYPGTTPTTIFVHDQAMAYKRAGHDIRIICPHVYFKKYSDLQPSFRLTAGDIQHISPAYFSLSNYGEYSFNNFTFCKAVHKVYKILKKEGFHPDIIHSHTFGPESYAGIFLQKQYGVPCIITNHGNDTLIPISQNRTSFLVKRASEAAGVICVSSRLKKELTNLNAALQIEVIINGFTPANFSSYEKSPFSLLTCGTLIPRKKFDICIKALKEILPKYPQAKLTIIGEGEEYTKLKNLCDELNVNSSVRFLGKIPNHNVLKEMNKSQIFVLPSVNEGFGIVYIEAMSQKCIAVGTKGEGIADIVQDKSNGYLVEPESVQDVANCIDSIFSDTENCKRLASNGYNTAIKYTWDKNAEVTTAFFASVISKRK